MLVIMYLILIILLKINVLYIKDYINDDFICKLIYIQLIIVYKNVYILLADFLQFRFLIDTMPYVDLLW